MNAEKTQIDQELDQAINLLKKAVKESHLKNQRHIDMTIPMASERSKYEKALALTRAYVKADKISEEDLKKRLGLI